jgi:SAM-dependent methyltransferase
VNAGPGTDLDPAKGGGGGRSQIAPIARSVTRSAKRHVRDVQHRLSGLPVPPWRLRSAVPGDFWAVGEEFRGYLVALGGLQPDDRVLEIGCRVGRMAIPLTRYLGSDGSYEGIDDSVAGTDWCSRAISSRFPNFTFRQVADAGVPKEGLPYEDEMFDFVLFGSIGGLAPDVFSACVNEGARVLRRGGSYFGTWYLVRGDSLRPGHPPIACTESEARRRLEDLGLTVEAVHRGDWDGQQPAVSFQDIVIARKG